LETQTCPFTPVKSVAIFVPSFANAASLSLHLLPFMKIIRPPSILLTMESPSSKPAMWTSNGLPFKNGAKLVI
jgi:hypothetical protein